MILLRRWAPWAVLAVVAVVGLVFGLNSHSKPTLDAQVMHIANQIRCPVCNGETAAQSNSPPSVEIRATIRQDLQKGESQGQILDSLVAVYGPGSLEKPPAKGFGLIVWILPVIAAAVMVAVLVLTFRRWRRQVPVQADGELADEAGPADEPGPADETAAGDEPGVGAGDETPSAQDAGPRSGLVPGRTRKGALIGVGAVLVIGGATWAIVASTSHRAPGQEVTGQALGAQAEADDLTAAENDATKGDNLDAVKEYSKVLQIDANQTEALTGEGFLLTETGDAPLVSQGFSMLAQAEKADPNYAPAHYYRGIAFLDTEQYSSSITELQWYLDHSPDQSLVAGVKTDIQEAQADLKASKATTTTTRS